MSALLNRRRVMTSIAALALAPLHAQAKTDFVKLNWSDLVPAGQAPSFSFTQNHDDAISRVQPPSQGLRTDWNGQTVRLPGFIVPLDFSGAGVSTFILVPFVGACVHVPPPPSNQLVFVTTKDPFESTGLYQAINVIGTFDTAATSTHLADIAYTMSADQIIPYKF